MIFMSGAGHEAHAIRFFRLRAKYLPQFSVPKHPQTIFLHNPFVMKRFIFNWLGCLLLHDLRNVKIGCTG